MLHENWFKRSVSHSKIIREPTQPDGWKTHNGRTTKKNEHSWSCMTFFRHSAVLSLPAILLHKVSIDSINAKQCNYY